MERTQKRRKLKWKKTGKGSLRNIAGYGIIKPNQTFLAYPEDIPKSFRDVVICLEELPGDVPLKSVSDFALQEAKTPPEKPKKDETVSGQYKIDKRGNGGWYDVVNTTTGKPMNDKALRENEAKELLDSLKD